MTNNFLPPDPLKDDKANILRSLILIFVIIFGGFFIFLNFNKNKTDYFITKVITPIKIVESFIPQIGGDIEINPPEISKPLLPKLQGEMLDSNIFTAQGIIVKDKETGSVLYAKNEYEKRPIASVTKLMSALVLLEKNPDWSSTTTVIGADSLDTHVYAGDTYTLEQLWQATLIGSSNKAIISLANALDWPIEAFVERMNQKALELGMIDTFFTDPSGLNDTNISTPSDLAILLEEALKQSKIKLAVLTPELNLYSVERKSKHHLWNTNWLLLGWIPNDFEILNGGKTGFITASGYNFVMQVGKNNHLLNVVILGAKEHEKRFTEARDVVNWVFANYKWPGDENTTTSAIDNNINNNFSIASNSLAITD